MFEITFFEAILSLTFIFIMRDIHTILCPQKPDLLFLHIIFAEGY